jgi:NAD(P)-dependent dehydrogenase (short-subunit alcohol dehydrogenase family)
MASFSSWPLACLHSISPVAAACALALVTTYAFITRHRKAAALADLCGRVVVICGASQGIARELALHCARARCRLVLASRNKQMLEELASICKALGAQDALVYPADFAHDSSATQLAAFVEQHYGCMDILVLNMIKPFYGPWSSVTSVRRPVSLPTKALLQLHPPPPTSTPPQVQSVREQFDVGVVPAHFNHQ